MSTRSGKRIHSTFENIQELDINQVQVKSERKNRSKRRKDNTDDSNAVLNNTAHFVHYPGDDALNDVEKTSRKLRRHTLKEHRVSVTKKQNIDDNFDMEKPRHTRKSKRFLQESELNTVDNSLLGEKEMLECPKKNKKNKNKKQNITVEVNEKIEEAIKENVPKNKKKSKKKKHLKQSGVLQVEDVNKENIEDSTQNKINVSNDSFHSAAGSLESVKPNGILRKLAEDTLSDQDNSDDLQKCHKKSVTPKILRRKSSRVKDADDDSRTINDVVEEGSTTKRKLSRSKKSVEQTADTMQLRDIDYPAKKVKAKKADSSFNSSNTKVNVTFEKSNLNNDNIDDKTEEAHNDTYEKSNERIIHTFEKSDQKLNETFEKSSDDGSKSKCENNEVPQTRSKRKVTNDKSATKQNLNSTFEKSPNIFKSNKTKSLDTTFDKENEGESLPIKDQVQSTNKKSDSINTTLDKSINNSHISINSDDSKTENIINTTPQLIESSMEETSIHSSPKPLSPQLSTEIEANPTTPLKREGTFTKDSPKVETPKARQPTTPRSKETRLSLIGTPDRRKSYTSPGRTPFPSSKTLEQKRKTLNVTHSIEKSVTRTSLVDTMPRATKVMFCSPINSPAVTSQIKRKVIKSNLKGSNKSFVFDESMSDVNRSATRKRSYTQSEADTVSRKRLRFGEEMQQSIDRLSRPRTVSATAKLSEPSTPSKKTPTKARPEAKVSRTKLPNFAELHQKRFEKMESLDECQERKAKRARQLLTPTGSVNILERISPKENAVDSPKKSHAKEAKNHTIQSLNPGYTRFGFRMNCEDNPFTKKQTDVKKEKPNALTRQGTFPSLAGTTSVRREAAKQTVMREKSFTEKRDTKRKENRTIIKGVRTNRRFELQMKMRNINA